MVAHRLGTLKNCDLLLQMNVDGTVRRLQKGEDVELRVLESGDDVNRKRAG